MSIIVPCYNEAARLRSAEFLDFLNVHPRINFLFVDDGSRDFTWRILQEMETLVPDRVRTMQLPKNAGKAEAVRQGMINAFDSGPSFVGFWDADLATPLSAIQEMHQILIDYPQHHAVFGARVQLLGHRIQRRAFRHYLGRTFATVASLVLRLPIYDTQCGAKLFRATPGFRSCLEDPFISRWIFDVELIARMLKICQQERRDPHEAFYELPLHDWDDVADSKVRPRDFVRAINELWQIRRRYRNG